jgi:hypothetical protein
MRGVDQDGAGTLGDGVPRAQDPRHPGVVALQSRCDGKRNQAVQDRELVLGFSDACKAVARQRNHFIGVPRRNARRIRT